VHVVTLLGFGQISASDLLLFILLGFGEGALIAGIALGIVLNYRGSGVINIGTGALALLGAYVFYGLRTGGYLFLGQFDLGSPFGTVSAFVLTMAVMALVGAAFDFFILRKLRDAAPLAKLVASVGLLLTVQASVVLRFGGNGQGAPEVLPSGDSVQIFGIDIPWDRFELTGIVVVVAAALAATYKWTRFGLATRAAAENETAGLLAGLAPARISMANTVLASVLAGALGVLVAPLSQLDPVTIPTAVVPALGAALLARFTSFGIAAVAGIAMGSIDSLVLYLQTRPWFPTSGGVTLPGVTQLVYFLIIVGVMFWLGAKLPERGTLFEQRLPAAPATRRRSLPTLLGVALGIVAFMTVPYDFRQALINSLIGVLVCLSLVVITGFVGQISLVQLALAGVGGYAVSKLAADAGIAFPIGPLIGACVATLFGLVAAVSALRVRGVNLAIVTLAAAVALENFVFNNTSWGGGVNGSPTESPSLFGVHLGPDAVYTWTDEKLPSPVFGFLCLGVVAVLGLFVASLRKSRLGQQMLAVRSNERAAAAVGISVRNVKLAAFGISSFIAGLAGAMYAYDFGSVSAPQYGIISALGFVAFAYLGGITTVTGALFGGLIVTDGLGIHAIETWTGLPSEWELFFGGAALIVAVVASPDGVAGAIRRDLPRLFGGVRGLLTQKPLGDAPVDKVVRTP
jgi:ABC-type branched-subunit amino acid transport system permease subunit